LTETKLYDNAFFQITSKYDEDEYEIETTMASRPVKYTRMEHFNVRPISSSVLNTDIIMCISKSPKSITITVTENDEYLVIPLYNHNFKFDSEYIRVYVNGRLLGRSRYRFSIEDSVAQLSFLKSFQKGDTITIDITPYKYREVYYQSTLNEELNVVDLHGYIDKPFDIRYYDVYLNGRKLSLNNIFAISPWKIAIVNRKSIYGLRIFEKERDYEYYGTEFNSTEYLYTLDDLFNAPFITNDEKNAIIDKIIDEAKDKNLTIYPNINIEDAFDSDGSNADLAYIDQFYLDELIPKTYANPDKLQYSQSSITIAYPVITSKYLIDPASMSRNTYEYDRRKEYESVYLLDPDIFIRGEGDSDTNSAVYAIGHLDDVSSEILSETIENMNDIE